MIIKHDTACCSLAQLSCSNEDSLQDLQKAVDEMRESSKKEWTPDDRSGGQRAVFVITTPSETQLEDNLKKLTFYICAAFQRRRGYPAGVLTMWLLKL